MPTIGRFGFMLLENSASPSSQMPASEVTYPEPPGSNH